MCVYGRQTSRTKCWNNLVKGLIILSNKSLHGTNSCKSYKKEDYEGDWIKKYDTSTINSFALVGERCDPDTIKWIYQHFPHVIINDTWW